MESRSPGAIGNIQGVLFDLDNTLYDRDQTFEQCTCGFVNEHFAAVPQKTRAEILEQIRTEGIKGYHAREAVFAEVLARSPWLPYDVDSLCALFYRRWLTHMALEEDTLRLLRALADVSIPMGVITNGGAQQHLKIDQLGLRSHTSCIFISEESGCRKPDPAIFQAAAACLNVPCEHTLFVGDNPTADIGGAHAVGMTTAWLHRGKSWPANITDVQPDFRIDSLGELLAILPQTQGQIRDE
jgi:putative hydrolase of the HAD superfamily